MVVFSQLLCPPSPHYYWRGWCQADLDLSEPLVSLAFLLPLLHPYCGQLLRMLIAAWPRENTGRVCAGNEIGGLFRWRLRVAMPTTRPPSSNIAACRIQHASPTPSSARQNKTSQNKSAPAECWCCRLTLFAEAGTRPIPATSLATVRTGKATGLLR